MSFSQYAPGNSAIHDARPGVKIGALVVLGTLLFVLPRLELALAVLIAVLALYRVAGIGLATAWAQLRPALWVIAIFFVAQLWMTGWLAGSLVVVRLAALLLLASLVTLTTRASDMIEALEKGLGWLRFVGINPAKISLALSLALRFIPVLAVITNEVREAQKVRGLDRSVIAVAVPLIVRTLKMADDVAAAIDARSYDP